MSHKNVTFYFDYNFGKYLSIFIVFYKI